MEPPLPGQLALGGEVVQATLAPSLPHQGQAVVVAVLVTTLEPVAEVALIIRLRGMTEVALVAEVTPTLIPQQSSGPPR